jgi:hypothetical protein
MSAMPPTSNDTAGVLCHYADDLLVMCRTEREAKNALDALTVILGELGLELKRAKTGSCTACCDESGCGQHASLGVPERRRGSPRRACPDSGSVGAMDRTVDLDAAASEIERRRSGWLANGLQPGATTWRESVGDWPYAITPDRDKVVDPDSVGVRITAKDRGEIEVVLFRGGWADITIAVHDDDLSPAIDAPAVETPAALGVALDDAVSQLRGRLAELDRG